MRVLELHASMRAVKRSEGRSSVQLSSYITRTAMTDERTGETYDARAKGGVEFTGLVAQDDAPEWAYDRRKLWNAVEKSAKRKDAQTAREIEVSMPDEFSADHRRETTLKIAHMLIRRYGGAAEYALHTPGKDGDQRNHHAHFLFTTRRFEENGQWAAKGRKEGNRFVSASPLDDIKRGPEEVKSLREEIAHIINDIAVRERMPVYVEHLSFEKRGIDREAQQHMGKNATAMQRRGAVTDIGTKNRDIAARNAERQQTREEIKAKVIQIDTARERLKQKQQQASPAPQTQDERYKDFYRDVYERRAAMVEAFERHHGQQEKELRQEAARLTGSLENVSLFVGLWRGITGRTRAERELLAQANAKLYDIGQRRQAQRASFERDRLIKLETLKAEQEREARQAERLAQAVGDTARPAPRQEPEARAAAEEPAPAETAIPASNYERKRREYFRQLGAQRKREREAAEEKPSTPARAFEQAAPPRPTAAENAPPAPANDIQPAPPTAPADPPKQTEYEKQVARYHRQRKQDQQRGHDRQHDRHRGPERDRG